VDELSDSALGVSGLGVSGLGDSGMGDSGMGDSTGAAVSFCAFEPATIASEAKATRRVEIPSEWGRESRLNAMKATAAGVEILKL